MGEDFRLVLFLCTGNYYRSRFAELLFNAQARQSGLPWRAESAGLAPNCAGLNPDAISPLALFALRRLDVVVPKLPRAPRDVTRGQLGNADRLIALSEREHRPLLASRFPGFAEGAEYWDIEDVGIAAPAEALGRLARLVEQLIGSL